MSSERTTALDTTDSRRLSVPLFADVEESLLSIQGVVGRKWHPIIVYYLLADGPLGFTALKERVDGISSKMLSESLDDLEAAGLVDRTLLSDQPVRVEYELTDHGRTLEPLISEMVRWSADHDFDAADADAETDDDDTARDGTVYAEGL